MEDALHVAHAEKVQCHAGLLPYGGLRGSLAEAHCVAWICMSFVCICSLYADAYIANLRCWGTLPGLQSLQRRISFKQVKTVVTERHLEPPRKTQPRIVLVSLQRSIDLDEYQVSIYDPHNLYQDPAPH